MISLDQIQKLESRVARAVELIKVLRKENASLTTGLEEYRKRIDEMEILIGKFKEDQGAIEKGVMSALEQLDRLEDGLTPEEASTPEPHAQVSDPTDPPPMKADEPAGEEAVDPDAELDIF